MLEKSPLPRPGGGQGPHADTTPILRTWRPALLPPQRRDWFMRKINITRDTRLALTTEAAGALSNNLLSSHFPNYTERPRSYPRLSHTSFSVYPPRALVSSSNTNVASGKTLVAAERIALSLNILRG